MSQGIHGNCPVLAQWYVLRDPQGRFFNQKYSWRWTPDFYDSSLFSSPEPLRTAFSSDLRDFKIELYQIIQHGDGEVEMAKSTFKDYCAPQVIHPILQTAAHETNRKSCHQCGGTGADHNVSNGDC